MTNEKIDFVIPWVDGNDPFWLEEKNKYANPNDKINKNSLFRNWDNLEYLFRGIEQFTPWVNKIYFLTYGHLPSWLNKYHEKLVIVEHKDFIPLEHLPIFNSHAIEVNLHKIKGLSEKFVYFNDDTFITKKIKSEVFFKNGLPVNVAIADIMHEGEIAHIIVNNIDLINKNFNRHIKKEYKKRNVVFNNFSKWFNFGYGLKCLQTLFFMHWSPFTGFIDYHHPQPFLKSTFEDVWSKEEELMNQVSSSKFRNSKDVNQYLFKYWQFAKGTFMPDTYNNAYKKRKYINIKTKEDAVKVADDIKSGKFEMYCVNDTTSKGRYTKEDISEEDFEFSKNIIIEAFEHILPQKSKFEL